MLPGDLDHAHLGGLPATGKDPESSASCASVDWHRPGNGRAVKEIGMLMMERARAAADEGAAFLQGCDEVSKRSCGPTAAHSRKTGSMAYGPGQFRRSLPLATGGVPDTGQIPGRDCDELVGENPREGADLAVFSESRDYYKAYKFEFSDVELTESAMGKFWRIDRVNFNIKNNRDTPFKYSNYFVEFNSFSIAKHEICSIDSVFAGGGSAMVFLMSDKCEFEDVRRHDCGGNGRGVIVTSINNMEIRFPDQNSILRSFNLHFNKFKKYIESTEGVVYGESDLESSIVNCDRRAVGSVQNIARLISDEAMNGNSLLSTGNTARELEQIMLTAVASGLPKVKSQFPSRTSNIASKQVLRAEEYIRSHAHRCSIKLEDLVAISGVSARSLHQGFIAFRGMSPMAYVRRYRMEKVRECLLSLDDGTAIARVAADWGFSQPGRFAGDYKRQFGELPSQTIQKRLNTSIGRP